jgi:D-3-phosphoglycerate dehydrogenase / 2-oxoglutarate reductase
VRELIILIYAAANQKGIYVANCPGMNSIAVAELAIGLMISLDRRIPDNVIDFKNGKWNKGEYSKAEGLFGKTLAIIGVGAIGKEVAKRALAFGMNVYGKDISRIEGVDKRFFRDGSDTSYGRCNFTTPPFNTADKRTV